MYSSVCLLTNSASAGNVFFSCYITKYTNTLRVRWRIHVMQANSANISRPSGQVAPSTMQIFLETLCIGTVVIIPDVCPHDIPNETQCFVLTTSYRKFLCLSLRLPPSYLGKASTKKQKSVFIFISCRNILNPAQLPARQVFGGNVPPARFCHSHTGKHQVSFVPQACELSREHFFVCYKWYFPFRRRATPLPPRFTLTGILFIKAPGCTCSILIVT